MSTDDGGLAADQGASDASEEVKGPAPALLRGLRIRRLLLLGPADPFTVDFLLDKPDDLGGIAPLSVIAGRTNTGKTSVLRFIEYVLGAKDFPSHPEVLRQVRSAALEVETPDGAFTIERPLDANRVHVYPGLAHDIDPLAATTLIVEPTSDPESISQFVLSTVGLQDIELQQAPTKGSSGTDRMSFRDLLWICLYLNERIGSQQLLHAGSVMKEIKLRQVVDAVFGVHDNERADLARRIKDAATALTAQRRALEQLTEFVGQQQPKTADQLAEEAQELDADLDQVEAQIEELETRARAASDFASEMRAFHAALADRATASEVRVRDRISLLDRFGSLRAQYADDIRKLTMLVEAETLFDQLSVEVCPACLSALGEPPRLVEGVCSLCHTDTVGATAAKEVRTSTAVEPPEILEQLPPVETATKELRAAKRRYKELDEYWQRLATELSALRQIASEAAAAEAAASRRLDAATKDALSPFIAERTELGMRRQGILVQREQVNQGINLHIGLDARRSAYNRAERHLEMLRAKQGENMQRPDRDRVIIDISTRYSQILEAIQYPKVHETGTLPPFIDSNLVPHVRGQHFKEASSGGQVLVTLAWALSVFEIAYESNAAHPGILMIDSPQKNLGGQADDTEFADIKLVERLYDHILEWLADRGQGSQVIIVDNTPPANADPHVRVRYTRDPRRPPFGLIANEVGRTSELGHDDSSGTAGLI